MLATDILAKGLKLIEEDASLVERLVSGKDLSKAEFEVIDVYSLPCANILKNMGLNPSLGVFAVKCITTKDTKVVFAPNGGFVKGLGEPPQTKTVQKGVKFVLTLFELMLNVCRPPHNMCVMYKGEEIQLTPADSVPSAVYPNFVLKSTRGIDYNTSLCDIQEGYVKFKNNNIPEYIKTAAQELCSRLFPETLYMKMRTAQDNVESQQDMIKNIMQKAVEQPKKYTDEQLIALSEYVKFMRGDYGA